MPNARGRPREVVRRTADRQRLLLARLPSPATLRLNSGQSPPGGLRMRGKSVPWGPAWRSQHRERTDRMHGFCEASVHAGLLLGHCAVQHGKVNSIDAVSALCRVQTQCIQTSLRMRACKKFTWTTHRVHQSILIIEGHKNIIVNRDAYSHTTEDKIVTTLSTKIQLQVSRTNRNTFMSVPDGRNHRALSEILGSVPYF